MVRTGGELITVLLLQSKFFSYRMDCNLVQVHSTCYKSVNPECNFGVLAPSMLPPHAVSTPVHAVAMETLIGSQPRRRETVSRT